MRSVLSSKCVLTPVTAFSRSQKCSNLAIITQSANRNVWSECDSLLLNQRTIDSVEIPDEPDHLGQPANSMIFAGLKNSRDRAPGAEQSRADFGAGLNMISCPSCSRVENMKFVELAQQVKELTTYAEKYKITIAIMRCRVNGPGETDDADLRLWCGPTTVNLKKRTAN